MTIRILAVTALLTMNAVTSMAQQPERPLVGKPFPNYLFSKVQNFKKGTVTPSDFKGKWLIINMWSLGCKSCFTGFHVIKEIRQQIGDSIQFLFVGKQDDGFSKNVESIYKKISSNIKLDVPAGFNFDLRDKWGFEAFPHLYIIDPEGILRHVTNGKDLSVSKVRDMLKGKAVTFSPVIDYSSKPNFDISKLTDRNNIWYSIIITESNGEVQDATDIDNFDSLPDEVKQKGWSVANVPLFALYSNAYFGKWLWSYYDTAYYGNIHPYPFLEIRDSSLFNFDYGVWPALGTYNAYLKTPQDVTTASLMHELQATLNRTFGYSVSIELREMPMWSLVAKPWTSKMIKSKGGKRYASTGSAAGGFILRNHTMHELVALLTAHLPNDEKLPFLDETNIGHTIDFTIEGDMTDFREVQRKLYAYGLSLVKHFKPMKVLVIRDTVVKNVSE